MNTEIGKPRVLLIGSGVLQAYGGMSWKDYLRSIADDGTLLENARFLECPSPLQAILLTDDHVDIKLKSKKETLLDPNINSACYDVNREFLRMGFDHILTTNYTYELEAASLGPSTMSEYKLRKMQTSTRGKAEPKYLLHTYNKVNLEGAENRIWHIHGEHRKPDSIVLGHYYYGNLLFRIKEEVDKIDDNRWSKNNPKSLRGASWIDAFLFGDIYCVGFGFSVFEFDLWWLLNRKAREKDNHGKMYFYEPVKDEYDPKLQLLSTMKDCRGEKLVEIVDFNHRICNQNANLCYQEFYTKVIADITDKLAWGQNQ